MFGFGYREGTYSVILSCSTHSFDDLTKMIILYDSSFGDYLLPVVLFSRQNAMILFSYLTMVCVREIEKTSIEVPLESAKSRIFGMGTGAW